MVAGFPEGEEFDLAGSVDDHHLARKGVKLVGNVARLRCQEVGSKNLGAVRTKVVLIHHFGQRNEISNVKFGVVVNSFCAGVEVDSDDLGLKETGPALERRDQGRFSGTGGSHHKQHRRGTVVHTDHEIPFCQPYMKPPFVSSGRFHSVGFAQTHPWRMVMCSSCVQESVAP